MINNILVGSPISGAPGLKIPERDSKAPPGSDSFESVLDKKMSKPPEKENKERDVLNAKQDKPIEKNSKGSTKTKAKAKSTGSKEEDTKKQAIKKFMDSYESELGPPSTRLVESIANLESTDKPSEAEKAPESAISAQGLDPSSEQRAMALYATLLAEMKSVPAEIKTGEAAAKAAGQGLAAMMIADAPIIEGSAPASAEVVAGGLGANEFMPSAQALSKMQLDSSLEAPKKILEAAPEELMQAQAVPQETTDATTTTTATKLAADPTKNTQAKPEEISGTGVDAKSVKMDLPQMPEMPKQNVSDLSPLALAALIAKNQQSQKAAASVTGKSSSESSLDSEVLSSETIGAEQLLTSKDGAQLLKPTMKAPLDQQNIPMQLRQMMDEFRQKGGGQSQLGGQSAGEKSLAELADKGSEAKSTDFKSTVDSMSPHMMPLKSDSARIEMPIAAAAATMTPATHEENQVNVKHILNQAQILIKNGGGEMSVKMTPEGLGEVHLKVQMQDGKMSMQMMADSKEAKQSIESSLAELKTSLAAHKLSIDHVKVDVVNSTNTENSTNNQTNMNSQGGHDQAKKFWHNFNENFGSRTKRESFFDGPGNVGYKSKTLDPLQPIEASASRQVTGKGRGLNLVA